MRLLHVMPSYLPAVRYGGPVYAVHGLCRALVAGGHQVDVFTTRVDGDGDVPVMPGEAIDVDGVMVHYFDVCAPRRWYRSPTLAAALAGRVHDYDLVHAHALFLHPVSTAGTAARTAGVPYVVSPRGMLVRDLFVRRNALVKRCWMTWMGRRLLERAAALHVTSDGEAHDVAAFGLQLPPLLTVPNGVDAVAGGAATARGAEVLFLGRLSWKKGIERLIQALALLPGRNLVIAGNDDEGLRPALMRLCDGLGVGHRVRFEGAVSPARRGELMARAGVFVLASHSENFANTVLEAMAAGCPVVVTPEVGLATEVRDHGCGRVCAGEPSVLAGAIDSVLRDPVTAAAMGAAGEALVRKRYLWPQVAAEMADGYRALLAARAQAA